MLVKIFALLILLSVLSPDLSLAARAEPTGKAPESTTSGSGYKFVGNTFSHKFHKPGCEFAAKMDASRVVFFKTREEAEKAGQKPCNWCLPGWLKNVRGQVLKGAPESTGKGR
ncbi:MAG: hypothetical protein KC777_23740 [Cyanobacteria bacterium HKST-UBA02]|nr:hypothetical protein [Cyanobacteria bacterium HKST-UBA02]